MIISIVFPNFGVPEFCPNFDTTHDAKIWRVGGGRRMLDTKLVPKSDCIRVVCLLRLQNVAAVMKIFIVKFERGAPWRSNFPARLAHRINYGP